MLSAAVNAPVRISAREEAGAAGAAMMSAVAVGAYPDMDACIADWVTPLLGDVERPDDGLAARFDRLYPAYVAARKALEHVWDVLVEEQARNAPGAR
jgi:erythritol kinase (D-erythritol 1-phosphate-forming)